MKKLFVMYKTLLKMFVLRSHQTDNQTYSKIITSYRLHYCSV